MKIYGIPVWYTFKYKLYQHNNNDDDEAKLQRV